MGNSSRKQFELWALEHGSHFYCIEKSENTHLDIHGKWWEKIDRDWESLIGPRRLDLMVDELKGLIRFLEQTTGRRFSETRFKQVMDLVNEQAEYNRKTRNLIAQTSPAPVTIVDTMPATMVPQWQRGTEWARDAAKAVYEEVKGRVDAGEAAYPGEKLRLAWIGTGLWFNMGFYQYFQEKYGAVFVWSIYLSIAADGYIRYGDDPLRALAARFTTLEEALHMNTWSSEWHVKEALTNQIDGVVTLQGHGGYFSTKALEAAGVPVIALRGSNVDSRGWDDAAVNAQLSEFIENRVIPAKKARG
jgi:benzoyl-CoA reductase/2-hydroxyglutaryl-CoA dehydratase subunit BcrC/BadD/HgdB